jgi:chemotaxis family two-component system response regulator Rcp1
MLVLSRDCDTVVRIGPCKVTVLSIRKRRVKLGIDAPRGIQVWREEIRPEPEQPGLRPEAAAAPAGREPSFTLLVEDDPAHARLISEALVKSCCLQPRVVGTGRAAMEVLGGDNETGRDLAHPRLVLLDLNLPDMSGLEVLRYIRSTAPLQTTPVVVLSVEDQDSVVACCLERGANAFVTKSPKYHEFRQSVSRIAGFWNNDSRVPEPAVLSGADHPRLRPR